ncbi:MAG: GatB/YqeY domain-containing protein [Bradyrhizobiaceae bacterium]|nr:GatB/YqeY domain-containing protein [Bradyrhizobiaceae bacterium]
MADAIKDTGAIGKKDMGKVMGMIQVQGKSQCTG